MSDDNTFEHSEKIGVKELADYFLKLADGFKSKSLELHSKGNNIALNPCDVVKLEVKAKSKNNEGELELEISWKQQNTVTDEKLEVTTGSVDESGNQ